MSLYKVQHQSGRILGPIDLEKIKKFIQKKQLTGSEIARKYPDGSWVSIRSFSEIAELFILDAQNKMDQHQIVSRIDPAEQALLQTIIIPSDDETIFQQSNPKEDATKTELYKEVEEKTELYQAPRIEEVSAPPAAPVTDEEVQLEQHNDKPLRKKRSYITEAKTQMLVRPTGIKKFLSLGPKVVLRIILLSGGLYWAATEYFNEAPKAAANPLQTLIRIKPKLPNFSNTNPDPLKSNQYFLEASKEYVKDNILSYFNAIKLLTKSVELDPDNVRSLALLASCYLNVVDATNKDESYFNVVSKLIDLSRSKKVDTTEVVSADVEFLLVTHRYQAAVNRIIEYTKKDSNIDLEMFYYIALAYFYKGEFNEAAKYLTYIPDHKAFSPRLFYLRGKIAEALKDSVSAKASYERALKMTQDHAMSRLALVQLAVESGEIKEVKKEILTLLKKPALLVPKDLAKSYYFMGLLEEVQDSWKLAAEAFKNSIKLDKTNHDYWLEYYTALSKQQDIGKKASEEAKMYFFLREGEKAFKAGKLSEAFNYFLQAKNAKPNAILALSKLGDFFSYKKDYINARVNYEAAAQLAPKDPEIWSKYIDVLIQNFEWEKAQEAMNKYRKMDVSQSFLDKAAGDLYMKQGRYEEAQNFYKRAMQRDSIDPEVYSAYAKSLIVTKNFAEAPFFLALARRFDPVGTEPILLTAQAVAEQESIEAGIRILQDELQNENSPKAEMLSGIAELYMKMGKWDKAEAYIEQAKAADPDSATPWRLSAKWFLNLEGVDKKATEHALEAYDSFIERNPSDSTGYYEKYSIYLSQARFGEAQNELDKLSLLYPKYPKLHYYRGNLFAKMSNFKLASQEYAAEIKNNPLALGAHLELGKSLIELKEYANALTYLQKAMEIAPKLSEAKLYAAIANHKVKNFQGAIALFQSAIYLDSGNPLLYKKMGECYRDMGDTLGAKAAFKKYLQLEPDAQDRAYYQRF